MDLNYQIENSTDVIDEVKLITKVILYNDEMHTFDEVIFQLIKATSCSIIKAEKITHEVHFVGKSIAYEGSMSKCLNVSSVLEEISLLTEIEV